MIAKLLGGKFLFPAIMVGMVAVGVTAFGAAWSWQNDRAEKKISEAVSEASREWQKAIERERELTDTYRTLADNKYATLMSRLSKIKVEHVTITNNIEREIESNRQFYDQQLPENGYKQWQAAKDLIRPQPAESLPLK